MDKSFLGFEEEVLACRRSFLWNMRDQHEIVRGHWEKLTNVGGLGNATEARLLFLSVAMVAEGAKEKAAFPAECFEALRVGAQALDASEGFNGPAAGLLPKDEARFLGEWIAPFVLERALNEGDGALLATIARLAMDLAVARNSERAYRSRAQPRAFDSVSLGILYGTIEAKYARPARLAVEIGAKVAGASEDQIRSLGLVGESIGLAFGYLAVLTERWDCEVEDQLSLRRHHVRSGRDAVRKIEGGLFILRSRFDFDFGRLSLLAERLNSHFETLVTQLEGSPMPNEDEEADLSVNWEASFVPPIDGEEVPKELAGEEVTEWESPIIPPADS